MALPPAGPEAIARVAIDAALIAAGWVVQHRSEMPPSAARGIAVHEFKLKHGHGFADYILFLDGKAVGVLETKAPGYALIGVAPKSTKYVTGLPDDLNSPITPLLFIYLSTGAVTKFVNLLDPEPRSRFVFHVHRPDTLAECIAAPTLDAWVKDNGVYTAGDDTKPPTLHLDHHCHCDLTPDDIMQEGTA